MGVNIKVVNVKKQKKKEKKSYKGSGVRLKLLNIKVMVVGICDHKDR